MQFNISEISAVMNSNQGDVSIELRFITFETSNLDRIKTNVHPVVSFEKSLNLKYENLQFTKLLGLLDTQDGN